MRLTSVCIAPYRLAFTRPIRTAAGVFLHRPGALVHLGTNGGLRGSGDAAPWPGFGALQKAQGDRTADMLQADLKTLSKRLVGKVLYGMQDVAALIEGLTPEVAHAVELACLDLLAQERRIPIAALLTTSPLHHVPVHALVSDAVQAKDAVQNGALAVKVKVGVLPLGEEGVRLGGMRGAIGANIGLRLDANGAWSQKVAQQAMRLLSAYSPEWLEQPVAADDIEGLALARQSGTFPVAADESVQTMAQLEAVIAANAADVIIIKPMFAGGLLAGLALHERAAKAGLRTIVTHALESAVGRMGALHLAAALGPGRSHGLGNPLAQDVGTGPVIARYVASVPKGPGLGVTFTEPKAHQAAAC